MASKKWYSYFVVTDESRGTPVAGSSAPPAASRSDGPPVGQAAAPTRAGDLAPDTAVDPALAAAVGGTESLDTVYAAARIDLPPHGYTVLKVASMLDSEHIRSLPVDVKRKSIMVALEAAGVTVAEIVEDAVRRDRALDTYERVLQQRLDALRAETEAENARLEEEIQQHLTELRARIDANTQRLAADQRELAAWQTRKQQEEALIARAVDPFVSENPITVAATGPGDQGDADVR